jgi:hypothetical protein
MEVFKRFYPNSKFVLAGDIFQSIQKEPRESVLWHYMNKEEKMEKLHFLQKFFFSGFIISYVLIVFSSLMCLLMNDFQLHLSEKFFQMDSEDFNFVLFLSFALWKILVVQFTLIPGIAVWGMRKCYGCCECRK